MALQNYTEYFKPEIVAGIINEVQGKSTIAKLATQTPLAFSGNEIMTFNLDTEVDVVAEKGAKTHGGLSLDTVQMVPVKIEYGARVSDEIMYAAEDRQIDLLKQFSEGFARKVARGLDLMAFHGTNPRTGLKSTVINGNSIDEITDIANVVVTADPDADIQSATNALAGANGQATGLALSPTFSSTLGTYKVNNVKQFPEFAWGQVPASVNGLVVDVNDTVSHQSPIKALAYAGDFANGFRWGYAKEIPTKVIEFGDPDNTGRDLAGHNEVYIRAEMYLGWGILRPQHFVALIEEELPTGE